MTTSVSELCQALVRIPSVNPFGDPGVENPGEQQCAEYVAAFLQDSGAVVEIREVKPGRPNVIGKFPTDRPGKPLVIFAPHLDTVSVVGMTIPPFSGEISEGKVWGRGATDTKGPMSSMLWALREGAAGIVTCGHEVWFVGLMGEETGQEGAWAFVNESIASGEVDPVRTFALVGEPTGLETVHTTKGACWISAVTGGKAVHASAPERGVNAIYAMADLVRVVRDELVPALSKLHHPQLGSPTISVGTIRGGTKTNIVPDSCRAEIDMRTIPGQDTAPVLETLRRAVPGVTLEIWQSKPLWTEPDHPLIAKLGAPLAGAPWFCDAAILAGGGIASVATGPGSIKQAHTVDEWISVADLEAGARFFRQFLDRL